MELSLVINCFKLFFWNVCSVTKRLFSLSALQFAFVPLVFCSQVVHAAYVGVPYIDYECNMVVQSDNNLVLACKPVGKIRSIWVPDPAPPASPPPTPMPPPPPPPPQSSPQKSADEIEKEAHKKWCAEQKANLPGAVLQCKSNAGRAFADALRYTCNGETSRTIQGGITVYAFGGTVSSTTSCSSVYSAEMGAQIARCDSDGFQVGRKLEEQCK